MRNMRQVIKTNHNFVTGEHYEQRVLKPVQASHNRVTIQLCDAASGKVVEEAVTENAITPLLESMAYGKIANKLAVTDGLNGASDGIAFSTIALSDSDIGELEDLYFVHGNIVGFCDRTDTASASSSKYKGIYNPYESYEKIEDNGYKHIHLVYDWQTSAGNGKIQNIYWYKPYVSNYENCPPSSFGVSDIARLASFYGLFFDRRGNAYKRDGTKVYMVLNFLKYINGLEPMKIASEESYLNSYEVNGYYYTFSSSYANGGKNTFTATLTINKHDTTGTIVDTWTEDLISSVPQLVELKNNGKLGLAQATVMNYCDYDGWIGFQVGFHSGSNSLNVFPTRNSAGELEPNSTYSVNIYTMYNVLTKQWLHTPSPWDVWCTYRHYTDYKVLRKLTDRHVCTDGYTVKITADDVEAVRVQPTIVGSSDYYASFIHPTLPICRDGSSYRAVSPIAAQTRLAAPITKTTLNTMKIQYDFFFKIPLPYMPPEHVWDLYK